MAMIVVNPLLRICRLISTILTALLDVAQFWKSNLFSWWKSKSPRVNLLQTLATARSFEEWEEAALALDEVLGTDIWRQTPASRYYDYRLIFGRLQALIGAQENDDVLNVVNIIRSGLVRNLANITSPRLFDHAYAGTKILIEDYITQLALSIEYVTALQTVPRHPSGFDSQAKLELLHDTRQAFGRSTLVLQGGAIFGVCHLGVIKALYLRGLLPRIITGTATGALIAALVGIHTEEELLPFLDGEGIDLSAFERQRRRKKGQRNPSILRRDEGCGWLQTLLRRARRHIREEYFPDLKVLEECVRANVGDLTFEEAYEKTKRILNITIAISGRGGFPNLLNYLTAPNVLIWSAAMASNASSTPSSPIVLYCKDETGAIVPWPDSEDLAFRSWRQINYGDRESPLFRLAELFNVNHFIVSQARPYLVPLLREDLQRPGQVHGHQWSPTRPILRLMTLELRHRLKQLDFLGLLPTVLRRLLIDEDIPGPSITLLPDLSPLDLSKVFQTPTQEDLKYWILKGERGVWPIVTALKVRCTIEIELEKGYQVVRRRPKYGLVGGE